VGSLPLALQYGFEVSNSCNRTELTDWRMHYSSTSVILRPVVVHRKDRGWGLWSKHSSLQVLHQCNAHNACIGSISAVLGRRGVPVGTAYHMHVSLCWMHLQEPHSHCVAQLP
jgi:hypothetical protein